MDSFFMKIPKFWPLLSKIPKKFPNISFTIWRQNPNMFTSRKTWESIVSKHILKFTKCDDFHLNTAVWKYFCKIGRFFPKLQKFGPFLPKILIFGFLSKTISCFQMLQVRMLFIYLLYIGRSPIYNGYIDSIHTRNSLKCEYVFGKNPKIRILGKNGQNFWNFVKNRPTLQKYFSNSCI